MRALVLVVVLAGCSRSTAPPQPVTNRRPDAGSDDPCDRAAARLVETERIHIGDLDRATQVNARRDYERFTAESCREDAWRDVTVECILRAAEPVDLRQCLDTLDGTQSSRFESRATAWAQAYFTGASD